MKAAWLVLMALVPLAGRAGEIYYTSSDDDRPGVVRVVVEDGRITSADFAGSELGLREGFKLARAGGSVAVSVGGDDSPALAIFPEGGGAPVLTPLPAELSDLTGVGDRFVAALAKGLFVEVDAGSGAVLSRFDARKSLTPPGRKGEHLCPAPGGRGVFASFQKDDDNTPAQGNRIVLLSLDPLAAKADLHLPRDRPELHLPASATETGPGPEIVVVCPGSNTLAITLDLYGAIAFADLDAALDGRLENLTYVPSSIDGTWGTAFPDRMSRIDAGGSEFLLVSNASRDGGLALFDPRARRLLASYPAPAGADAPIWFPELGLAATVVSGKVKSRTEKKLEKQSAPGSELLLWDFSAVGNGGLPEFSRLDVGFETLRIVPAGPRHALVLGKDRLALYDLAARAPVATMPAPAPVERAIGW